MVRRLASQVHQQVSRLMRGEVIKEPAWYAAVLDNPPLPLPPKSPPNRTAFDLKQQKTSVKSKPKAKPYGPKPFPVYYLEDDIRRQFFRDHPFEAFRPITLAEGQGIEAEHPITGAEWTRLRQRGRNPSPDDAIQFTLNLHQHHKVPLSYAYARAIAQFRALRSERHIALTMAIHEAENLGAVWQNSEIAHGFQKEIKSLASWERQSELDEGAMAARKRWRSIALEHTEDREWSKGQEYVRLWKEGYTPRYAPALTEPVKPATQENPKKDVDTFGITKTRAQPVEVPR
ncbi:mitochondrial ribosomal protein S25-domain-containing protein [Lentinula aff. detonsa]|uniref:Small ribosomal subunit protein mS23 n=1 Tax=Lentinula aff. detonsa TaxID=2804958 RepID=A0AA38KNW2_9AGAR|nr:mitochondrial ribosomal protein S25-domain-containing protein [Lentinula aff. detonsa]